MTWGVQNANQHDNEHAGGSMHEDPNHGTLDALMQLEQPLGAYLAGGPEETADAARFRMWSRRWTAR